MFFNDMIQRRLATLLHPWLRQEPELELKLGFLRSRGIVQNLSFDTSALNQLLDQSSRLSFKEVTVDHLSLRVSNWSSPAFTIEVRGLHVILSTEEVEGEGCARRRPKSTDTTLEDKKKVLSEIDPEGSALHEAMESISEITSLSSRTTSLLNVILQHCWLQMHDIHLQLQIPISNNSFSCFWQIKELTAEPEFLDRGCFLQGFIYSLLVPSRVSSFSLDIRGCEIGWKSKDHISHVLLSADLLTSIKLIDFQLKDFNFCIPELRFSFSPADLPFILAFNELSSKGSICIRNGRQLWKIAASRIRSLISTPRLSLHMVVLLVCRWLRYVHAYQNLLLLVGYPMDKRIKRSAVLMSQDKILLRSVKHQWEVISETEKELPAEAIALARRVIRFRAASNFQQTTDSCNESLVNSHFKVLWKILQLSVLICGIIGIIGSVFNSIICFSFLRKFMADHKKIDRDFGVVSKDSFPQRFFSINVGKFLIIVSPANAVRPAVGAKPVSDAEISYLNLLSFHLSIDAFLLIYTGNVCERCFSFSCGRLKVMTSSVMEDGSNSYSSYFKGRRKKKVHDSKAFWVEPAQTFYPEETARNGSVDDTGGTKIRFLESHLEELWISWRKYCTKFDGSEIQYLEDPCILCEIKCSLTDQGLKTLTSRLWKCSLVMGKLNFVLGYSSILSITLLFRQIQHGLYWTNSSGGANVVSDTPTTYEDPPVSYRNNGVETAILRILPEKHIQIAAFIAGPHIRISLGRESFHGGKADANHMVRRDDLNLSFEIHNIEFAVSPTLTSNFVLSTGDTAANDAESEWPKEPQIIGIPKLDNSRYLYHGWTSLGAFLKVNGLNAYIGDSAENQQYQIILLNPMTIQLSSLREDLHSFGTAVVTFSAALRGMAMGLTALLFMDELFFLVEAVVGLFSAVSCAFTLYSVGGVLCQELIRQERVYAGPESKPALMSGATRASLILLNTRFVIKCSSMLKSLDIVLYNSRKSNNVDNVIFDAVSRKKLAMHDVPDYGICTSVQNSCVEFSFNEGKLEAFFEFSGIQFLIFRYLGELSQISDQFELKNLLLHSMSYLYEFSISHCTLALWLRSLQNALSSESASRTVHASTSGVKISPMEEGSPLAIDGERLRLWSSNLGQKLGFDPNIITPTSSHWLLTTLALSDVCLTGTPIRKPLIAVHRSHKLQSSLSIGGENRTISCRTQGGCIFLETTALVIFVQCFTSYCCCIKHLLSLSYKECVVAARSEDMAIPDDHPNQGTINILQQINQGQLEAFTVDLSQFYLILVSRYESGRIQELMFEADVHLNLEVANMKMKLLFDLSRFSIVSQILHETPELQTNETQTPHSSSVISGDSFSPLVHGDPTITFREMDGIHSVLDDASFSNPSVSQKESYMDKLASQVLHLSPQHYILRELGASIAVERPVPRDGIGPLQLNHVWVGSGSLSGFNMTISLSEIQMILFAVESLSGVFSKESPTNVEQRLWSSNQEASRSLEDIVPDGTIVAIQDVHQHMYITVEGEERKYNLVGAIHYSLVGERALFRVKYHNLRRWRSSVPWFSLISLHAKSDLGEPLRLNCRPGSGFVDISSSNDSGWTLWRMFPYKPEGYDGDTELEPYCLPEKNTFYLVNKKNDCAIAFVDGVVEFVKKPGNPFKWKVFHDLSLVRDILLPDSYPVGQSRANLQHNSHVNEERISTKTGNFSCIKVTVDKVSLTIVEELSDTREMFPLLQGSISTTEVTIQILFTKVRFMSRLEAVLYYFDAHRNLWREFVHPVEIWIFYRSRFHVSSSEIVLCEVPVHFYARVKELSVSITELSLDILLFVIGKLNMAGPFAVRSSVILANCCKVENQSGLTVLCHFYGNQDASIPSKESTTIFLRHLALVDQPPEASFVSIQLAERGAFSTAPIHLSLVEAHAFAWRTRIVSLQDSKSYPGPFVIVKISRKAEDGLSIVVSPLLRIYNETDSSMELRFQRCQQKETEFASLVLKAGDTIDDSMTAFDAFNLSGGSKKALRSLSVGNFLFSFRPQITDDKRNKKSLSVEWSDDLKGGKAVRLSGIFDKLSYQVRKAFAADSVKCTLSTAHCSVKSDDGHIANMHFLIQSIGRDIPVMQPDNFGYALNNRNSPVALQEQKEIFLLPTVQVSNLLQSEIHVLLSDTDPYTTVNCDNICNQATIPSGSTVNLHANPATIYFVVTLAAFSTSCRPVNSGDWVKRLHKQKNNVHRLDIELEFGSGKYFAFLGLSRGPRGILEAAVFTSYTLKNDTDFSLFCFSPNQKPLPRDEAEKFGSRLPPELGAFLPPKSTSSWFMKSNKLCLKLLEEEASEALLDLDALSGLTEIDLEVVEESGLKSIAKLVVSLRSSMSKVVVPSQIVCMNPRYVLLNESEEAIIVRQCYLEDDMEGMIAINSKQKIALRLRAGERMKRETSIIENLLRKHRNTQDDSLLLIQFRPSEGGFGWSGPVCVSSLGRFFLKFRRSFALSGQQSNQVTANSNSSEEFAAVHVVEEGSTLVLHFHRPPNVDLPYRIENCLLGASITYYQKGSSEPEILGSGNSVNYVWDDSTLPRKLVVQIDDMHVLREINLDKVRTWKPFYRVRQHKGLGFHLSLNKTSEEQKRTSYGQLFGMEMVNLGYEVYTDGPTRILRICEFSNSRKGNRMFYSTAKMRLRISHFAVHLLEHAKQEIDASEPSTYMPVIVMRLGNINLDSMFTDQHKFIQIQVQTLSVDEKWVGAPFAAMLRRHQLEYCDTNDNIFRVVLVLLSSSSNVKQIKYSSIILQPLDLKLDEETLMRIAPFWRTSLSDSNAPSQQYYFDHFEVHPIKIVASFLPGDSYSSYSSTQETLRSLLHSVIKIPAIKDVIVELNGVLVTHALITIRELSFKCAQHYSWYAMRAIYIAKGSPLLPPAFASIFDDSASSSLDVFFDPSSGLINLPGLTLGTFKLIRKCIEGQGFSGTKRYFGDLGKTIKMAGSNILFAAVTEISDSVLKGAETSGLNGMVNGFHQGILKLAMEPSVLGSAFMEGGPDRKIKLDRSPGVDELYVEGYLQAMLDTIYKQEYLRVRVMDNQVVLKNLPPNSSLIDEIMDRVKGFLVSKALLKGDSSTSHSLRHLRGESEWKIGPTVLTLCEHLLVSFAIRVLRKQACKVMTRVKWEGKLEADEQKATAPASTSKEQKLKLVWKWGIGKFVLSGIVAYIDGRLCRCIPNPVARRIVSGFLLSFLDKNDNE